jgi:hypothetical protein
VKADKDKKSEKMSLGFTTAEMELIKEAVKIHDRHSQFHNRADIRRFIRLAVRMIVFAVKRDRAFFDNQTLAKSFGIAGLSAQLVPKVPFDEAELNKLYDMQHGIKPKPEPETNIWDTFSRN